jgi:hypothetical protein
MAEAVKVAYGPGQPGFDEFRFARAAARDIKSLGDSGEGLCSAVLLARNVIDLLQRAALARAGHPVHATVSGNEVWARWLELPMAAKIPIEFTEEQRALIPTVLALDGTTMLTRQPLPRMRFILSTLLDATEIILEPMAADATQVKRIIVQRWLRLATIVLVVLLGGRAIWHKITDRPNLALNKAVSLSSMDVQVGVDPQGLVDGNRYLMGFHTMPGSNQTATIDLGSPQKISRIVVYNRSDCCQERAVPLRIAISEDGKTYRTLMERKEPFVVSFTADFPKTRARYVKLTALQNTVFHLNEVEVY